MKVALFSPGICLNLAQRVPSDVLAQYRGLLAQPLQPQDHLVRHWTAVDRRLWAQIHVAKAIKGQCGRETFRSIRSGPERLKYALSDSEKQLPDSEARWIEGASFLLPMAEGQAETDPRRFYVRPFLLERFQKTEADGNGPDSFHVHEAIAGPEITDAYLWQLSLATYLLRQAGLPVTAEALWVETAHNQFEQRDVTAAIESRLTRAQAHVQTLSAGLMALPPVVFPDTREQATDYPISALLETGDKYAKYNLIDRLVALGILDMRLVPDPQVLARDFPRHMGPKHVAQIVAHKAGRGFIDLEGLRKELEKMTWPVFSVDFETTIPKRENELYVPHQFACRIVHRDGSVLVHDEFLPKKSGDPRLEFARALGTSLGRNGAQGSILVYHADFEISRIRETAAYLENHDENELAKKLLAVIPRVVDLLVILRRHVYLPGFHGSFSLKDTYPALVGVAVEESYQDLPIQKGDQAAAEVVRLMGLLEQLEKTEEEPSRIRLIAEIDELRKNLFDYCGLDVKAPLRILFELIKESVVTA